MDAKRDETFLKEEQDAWFDCPSCENAHRTKNSRDVKTRAGRLKLCRTCFTLGPAVVLSRIAARKVT